VGQEKLELLDEGFGDWTRSQFFHFVKANAKYGRDDIASIAADMDMPEEQVAPYSRAFWKYGPTELKDEWERFVTMIEKGEKKLEKQKKNAVMLKKFVSSFENPRHEMVFANKGTTYFALEQDRALLCAVDTEGYGNWESVRESIRHDNKLKFQHSVQGMTTAMMAKRADYRIRQVERELEAREKALKNQRPANVVAAQKALDAIKAMEKYEVDARTKELQGEEPPPMDSLDADARQVLEERQKERDQCVRRLREIEGQVSRCYLLAEETRQGIYRGDQYVNFSNINLKGGTTFTTAGGEFTFEVLPELESGEIEARLSKPLLKIPACGQCENCIDKGDIRKLCVRRMEERKRLIIAETKKALKAQGKPTTNIKPGMISTSSAAVSNANGSSNNGNAGNAKKRKSEFDLPPAKKSKSSWDGRKAPRMIKTANGLKPRVTSQGNKRMSIPDHAFPDFCRRIGPYGTHKRMELITAFAEEHPTTSVRQVTLKLGEITVKEPPACLDMTGVKPRAFTFYLAPRYYKYLPAEERPKDWEKYAKEDEIRWEKVKEEERLKKAASKKDKNSSGGDSESEVGESASNVSPSIGEEQDDTEDERDEVEPVAKKLKVES